MLNLLRVEMGKLLRGKTFWIVLVLFLVAIFSTYIPLSYVEDVRDSLGQLGAIERTDDGVFFTDRGGLRIEITNDMADIEEINRLADTMHDTGNFVQAFYSSNNGQLAILLIIATVFVIADFANRTLGTTLLAGYSREQVYLSKLAGSFLGCCLFQLIAMIGLILLGVLFYDMQLTAENLRSCLLIYLAQCVMALECCGVFTASGFLFGGGMAFLGSILFFSVLPGSVILWMYMTGGDMAFAAAHLPSMISIGGGSIVIKTLEQMVASPQLWTAGFLAKAMISVLLITGLSTLGGIYAFRRRNL